LHSNSKLSLLATASLSFALLAGTAGRTAAQVLYGTITGNVSDTTGALISGASILVTNTASGVSAKAVSNSAGTFLIQNLQPATYDVKVSDSGYASALENNVTVIENTVQRVNVSLTVGAVSQAVTVTAQGGMLQTDRADVNMTIDSKQIQNLSTGANRNFQNLYELIPGFSGAFSTHSSAGNPAGSIQFAANGISFSVNSTSLDGASDVYQWIPDLILYVPPDESIASVNVVTADYTADQGMVGGSITNIITKSGGNAFHGSAWEYHTDNALDAKPYFFSASRLPKSIQNQFGALASGPILRNKLFFFADWERTAQISGVSGYYTVPTAAMRAGDFSSSGTPIYDPATGTATGTGRSAFADEMIPVARQSTAALILLKSIPLPNTGTASSLANNYFHSESIPSTQDNYDTKINYDISPATNAFLHYSLSKKNVLDPFPFGPSGGGNTLDGGIPGNADGTTQLATIGATSTLSPHLVVDGNLGYSRQVINGEGTDIGTNYGLDVLGIPGTNGPNTLQSGLPAFNINSISAFGNTNGNGPFSFVDNQFAIAGAVHYTVRNHNFSFGTQIIHFALNHFQTGGQFPARGGFTFDGGNTATPGGSAPNGYNSFADYLLGLPSAMGTTYQYFTPNTAREWQYSLYAEDQYQLNAKNTITYGLRWELYPFAHANHFGGTVYDPAANNVLYGGYGSTPFNPGVDVGHGSFLPRFGFASRVTDKTVIRGGFAVSVNPSNFKYILKAYPYILSTVYNATNGYTAAGDLRTGIPALPTPPVITQGSLPLPSDEAIISYQRNYNRGQIQSYNLGVEQQVLPWMAAQLMYVGNNASHMNCVVDLNAGSPGLGVQGQPFYQKYGNSNAHQLYEPICPSNFNALESQLKVRGAGLTSGGISYTYGKGMSYGPGEDSSVPYSGAAVFSRNYALNNYDIKHNLKVYGTYQLPFGKGERYLRSGLVGEIAGGWRISNVLTYRSGTPFTVSSSGASLNAPAETQTANQLKAHVAIYGAHAPGYHYFDPTAFAPVTTATYGDVRLNSLRGPGLFRLDTGLRRSFNFGDRASLLFLAQAFGITNTPQFGNPGSTVSNAGFADGGISAYNGYDTITSAGGSRVLQFGLKLSY
jgi:hypothetical protein